MTCPCGADLVIDCASRAGHLDAAASGCLAFPRVSQDSESTSPESPSPGVSVVPPPTDPMAVARQFVRENYSASAARSFSATIATRSTATPRTGPRTTSAASSPSCGSGSRTRSTGRRRRRDPELVPFEPTKYKVANVLEALKAIGHIAEAVQPPVWLDGDAGDPYQRGRGRPARERDPGLRDARARDRTRPSSSSSTFSRSRSTRRRRRRRAGCASSTSSGATTRSRRQTLGEWFGYVLSNDTDAAEDVSARRAEAVGQGHDRPRPDRPARRAQHRRRRRSPA